MTIAIIGAGQAGLQVAASLRELRYDGRVVLIGDEPHTPYQRPPLSKGFLLGDVSAAQLALRPDAFFTKHDIEISAGKRTVAIDRAHRLIGFEDDSVIPYEQLVLATGARNRPLPVAGAELRNVHFLRTLDDADALRSRLHEAKHVVVIGAGFIGLEFAAVAAKRGVDVTVIEVADRPMARALSRTMSDVCTREHERCGVRLLFDTQVLRLIGEQERVVAVETVDGRTLEADLVVVGIGVIPNAELAAACDLTIDDGIVVDEWLRTSDPQISAIGDVASHVSAYAEGQRVRLESVQNAIDQARCVAARIAGQPSPYQALPWFWSHQGSLQLQMAGLRHGKCEDVVRGDRSGTSFSVFSFQAGRLVCVESLNRPADHMLARRLLAGRHAVTPEQAADTSFELKSIFAAKPAA
jgi:3-phenylpropionate/trans-cinnamate dioxygenase ferredoxin reductase component